MASLIWPFFQFTQERCWPSGAISETRIWIEKKKYVEVSPLIFLDNIWFISNKVYLIQYSIPPLVNITSMRTILAWFATFFRRKTLTAWRRNLFNGSKKLWNFTLLFVDGHRTPLFVLDVRTRSECMPNYATSSPAPTHDCRSDAPLRYRFWRTPHFRVWARTRDLFHLFWSWFLVFNTHDTFSGQVDEIVALAHGEAENYMFPPDLTQICVVVRCQSHSGWLTEDSCLSPYCSNKTFLAIHFIATKVCYQL